MKTKVHEHSLKSKVALITGAAKRIGAEIARILHAEGMNVVIHYHLSHDEALALCHELNQQRPHSAIALSTDLTAPENDKNLIQRAMSEWMRLDVLVNNASRFYRTAINSVTEYAWDDLLSSNLKAPFFLSQAAAPYLAEHQGTIINIADIHAERPMRDYSVYCISKSGLIMLTKSLAKELGPHVRVNAVSPGPVEWPEGENSLSEDDKQKMIHRTALKRAGSALDVAKAVLFLVRDADYVTGHVLHVDGGRTLSGK